jgi:hypothetical protein
VFSGCQVVFFYNLYFVIVAILSVDHIPIFAHNFSFGVPSILLALASLYVGMAHLENSIAEKPVMWLGSELVKESTLIEFLERLCSKFQ